MDYGKVYGELHENAKLYAGYSLCDHAKSIAELVYKYAPNRLLDYGCGKGYQYLAERSHEAWGGLLPHCYDPGVRQLSAAPTGTFDGIICTDVLEHIEEPDLPALLTHLFSFCNLSRPQGMFVFLVISCRPSRKRLPDGRDVHVTIREPQWWSSLIEARRPTGCNVVIDFDEAVRG